MDFKQVYDFTNIAVKEVLGETAVVNEDLSNIVDIGTQIFNANSLDKYVNALVDRIGKVVFVDRVYRSKAPSILVDGWTYGQVLQKIDAGLPEAVENPTWDLQDGQSYDPNVFRKPSVTAKFFNKRTTFEVDVSVPTIQARGAFTSPSAMGRFIDMIFTKTENSVTLRLDKLIQSTIASMMAETYNSDISATEASTKSGIKAVNLLKLYNDFSGEALTADKALKNLSFLKFATEKILAYSDYMEYYSKLYNVGGTDRFTEKKDQKIVLLSDFQRSADVYLQSGTYHNEMTKLPEAQKVAYWQGTGEDLSFDSLSKIDVRIPSSPATEVKISHAIGAIFDKDALGVCCIDRRVTAQYNAKAEFTNYFYKFDAGYWNDLNENCVMFFIA